MKTFAIKTLGCKVNQYESQLIREQLLSAELKEVSFDTKLADIYVINTCTVTRESDQKSLKYIRDRVNNNNATIIATGCLTELDEDLFKQFPNIILVKNAQKDRISELLNIPLRKDRSPIIQDFKNHSRVFVKIQDGCDNLCSYCKVRLVRGSSVSKPFREIIEEVNTLAEKGFQEIVLTGICLGSYGRDISKELNLSSLLGEILKLNGRFRIRLSSIEPGDVSEELIELIKIEKRLCKHLHIPFQSGDNRILQRMNRPYTREAYIEIVERLRIAVSDIAIATDIMVGFPEETDENFENTLEFIKIIKPSRTHIFPFSRRKHTPAYNMAHQVEKNIIQSRIKCLAELCSLLAQEFANKFLQKEVEVLVEKKKDRLGYFEGYSDRYLRVHIKNAENFVGELIMVKLEEVNNSSLIGSLH